MYLSTIEFQSNYQHIAASAKSSTGCSPNLLLKHLWCWEQGDVSASLETTQFL